jgi:hypothetical protein
MRSQWVAAFSTLVAGVLALAIVFRPAHLVEPRLELAAPARLPPLARAALHQRMQRHGSQLGELLLRVVLLDRGAVARIGGEIYDEPTLGRPLVGDALEGQLPESFFQHQEALRQQARHLVTASAAGASAAALTTELAALSRTCISCHDAFLHDPAGPGESPDARRLGETARP